MTVLKLWYNAYSLHFIAMCILTTGLFCSELSALHKSICDYWLKSELAPVESYQALIYETIQQLKTLIEAWGANIVHKKQNKTKLIYASNDD